MQSSNSRIQARPTLWPLMQTFAPDPLLEDVDDWVKSMNITDDLYELILEDRPTPPAETAVSDICSASSSFFLLGESYKVIHGYIALLICLFGTVANILNLIVLTRKEMATPINRMLTALAFADMLVMIEYVPFAFEMYIIPRSYSYPSAIFVLFHSHFTQILHTISIQLTLSMAVWRYIALKQSNNSSVNCTMTRCHRFILAAFLCPILICIPNYLMFSIEHERKYYFTPPYSALPIITEAVNRSTLVGMCETLNKVPGNPDHGLKNPACLEAIAELDKYVVDLSHLAKARNGLLHGIQFWTFSVIVKLIPCVLLTFFMCWLVNTLYKAKRRHKLLQAKSGLSLPTTTTGNGMAQCPVKRAEAGNQMEIISPPPAQIVVEEPSSKSGTGFPAPPEPVNGQTLSCQKRTPSSPESSRRESNVSKHSGEEGKGERRTTRAFINFRQSTRKGSAASGKKSGKRSDRTSKMLIAVLCLFLLTEFPQGIMGFLSGVYGQEFFRKCYSTWAEVWDVLALLNSAINFILYCGMSNQFRQQFRHIFKPYCCIPKFKYGGVSQPAPETGKAS